MSGDRHSGLLLIDIQNDYFPGGRMELRDPLAALEGAKRALDVFRSRSLPVFHVKHLSQRSGAGFFIEGTEGAEIRAELAPAPDEPLVLKHYPNSFRETGLHELLKARGVVDLVVCGMMTHMCVDTTVRAAFDLGYKVRLLKDAVATRDLVFEGEIVPAAQVQAAFLSSLSPVFCGLTSSAEL